MFVIVMAYCGRLLRQRHLIYTVYRMPQHKCDSHIFAIHPDCDILENA